MRTCYAYSYDMNGGLAVGDSWLHYVPVDPWWQPTPEAAESAASLLSKIAPQSDEVEHQFHERVQLIHPYENWSGVLCPSCSADLDEWWSDGLEAAAKSQFNDLTVATPCCGTTTSLNDLNYVWPTAFGRFFLVAMNPNIEPTAEQERDLAARLGSPIRKVWQHL